MSYEVQPASRVRSAAAANSRMAGGLPVAAAQHRLGLVLQIAHQGLAGVAAPVGVVQRPEQLADRAQRRDVAGGDPGALGAVDPVGAALPGHRDPALYGHPARPVVVGVAAGDTFVRAPDQPVPAGHDESGRGEGDLAQLGVAAGVLAPQPADDVHRLTGARGELQPGVHRRTGVQAEVLGGQPAVPAAWVNTSAIRAGVVPLGCWPRSQRVTDVLS